MADTRPGAGSWLWAKSAFRTATQAVPVLRGTSRRPLYVTAAGMPRTEAAGIVRHMAGAHRIPDALRRAGSCWPAGRIGPLPDAMKPGFHGAGTHWIRGSMTFQLARRTRIVMLVVPK